MCKVNVVNRISCICLITFLLKGIGGGFGHPGHPMHATPLLLFFVAAAENHGVSFSSVVVLTSSRR